MASDLSTELNSDRELKGRQTRNNLPILLSEDHTPAIIHRGGWIATRDSTSARYNCSVEPVVRMFELLFGETPLVWKRLMQENGASQCGKNIQIRSETVTSNTKSDGGVQLWKLPTDNIGDL